MDTKMHFRSVDAGSNRVAFVQMDGPWLGAVDSSVTKVKTAVLFTMATDALSQFVRQRQPSYNIEHSNGGLINCPGGVVIKNGDGDIFGAIGVSGSIVENNHLVAGANAVK
ncbi:MAG: GlcG/HbpS family heme-binding protein [Ferruginibacter sp.]